MKAVRSDEHGRRRYGHGSKPRSVWAGSLCQCESNGSGIVAGDDSGEDIKMAAVAYSAMAMATVDVGAGEGERAHEGMRQLQ